MKNIIKKNIKAVSLAVFIVMFSQSILYAYPGGITGRTLKTTTSGCSCHGNSANTGVTVTISGPDTLNTGQTGQYTLTISRSASLGAGLDVAVRSGVLAPVSSNIHLSSGELTQNNNISMTSGSVSVQFSYTAPSTATIDTVWSTGLATNSNGNTSGDFWNWANSKRIVVRTLTSITNISGNTPSSFSLEQNYPNPFNPSTMIKFAVPKNSAVKLSIYDMSGKEVAVIVNEVLGTGEYEISWYPKNLASGIYFYTLKSADFIETKRMVLTK
jgi:hypothetical protein